MKQRYVVLIVLFLGTLLLSIKILNVPPGINGDEAAIGLNSSLISKTLKDENGNFLPLFVNTLHNSDWKQPTTIYTTAIFFKIFGPSFFLLRFVSVIFCLISAALLYTILDKYVGYKEALIGLAIFFTTPIIVIQSHLALENIAPLPFILLWLFYLLKYLQNGKGKFLFYAGLSIGLSIYSYNGMRLVAPALFIGTIGYITHAFSYKFSLWKLRPFIIGFIVSLLILILLKNTYPGAIFGSARPLKITSFQEYFLPLISSFDFSFLFLKGDNTPYHSTGKAGLFLLGLLPFFILGCLEASKLKNHLLNLSLIGLTFTPIFYPFVGSIYRGSRLLVFVPFIVIISTAGISFLLSQKKIAKRLIFLFLVLFLVFNFVDFLNDYWFYYPLRVKSDFNPPIHKVFKQLRELSRITGKTPFIEEGLYISSYPASNFFENVYFNDELYKFNPYNKNNKHLIILARKNEPIFENNPEFTRTGVDDTYSIYESKD